MKATGIVRKIDELGRVVLPKKLRKEFDINEGDPVEILVDNGDVIFKKYHQHCIFCDSIENVRLVRGQFVCQSCISKIIKL